MRNMFLGLLLFAQSILEASGEAEFSKNEDSSSTLLNDVGVDL